MREHFETFRAAAATIREGEGLPHFVEEAAFAQSAPACLAEAGRRREFRAFLRCGCLPFSCKGRGFCPSCGGRRMTELAAHLVDRVLPAVPTRQWVLTVPVRLRYVLAWDHDLCRAVVGVAMRTIVGYLRHLARGAVT